MCALMVWAFLKKGGKPKNGGPKQQSWIQYAIQKKDKVSQIRALKRKGTEDTANRSEIGNHENWGLGIITENRAY